MLRLSTLLILVHSVLAVDNYCQWAPIWASGDTIINPFINGLYLFEPSDCDGTTCTIIRDDGASFNATDGQPTVGVAYTCDNNVYRSPTNFGAVIGSETHYMCTCSGSFMTTLASFTFEDITQQVNCSNANGDYCGPFLMQIYYCGTSGSWSNDVETEKFSNCSAHASCDSRGGCVSYDGNTQSFSNCNGGVASEGETLYGGGGSASASTTNSCGPCVLDPSLDPRCASKFASSGSGTTASSSAASNGNTSGNITSSATANRQAAPLILLFVGAFVLLSI